MSPTNAPPRRDIHINPVNGQPMPKRQVHPCQTDRVLDKFGGAKKFIETAVECQCKYFNLKMFEKWRTPFPRGSAGMIPLVIWPEIIDVAFQEGILIIDADGRPSDEFLAQYASVVGYSGKLENGSLVIEEEVGDE